MVVESTEEEVQKEEEEEEEERRDEQWPLNACVACVECESDCQLRLLGAAYIAESSSLNVRRGAGLGTAGCAEWR